MWKKKGRNSHKKGFTRGIRLFLEAFLRRNWETNYLPENDRGSDDAEHDWDGVFLIHDPQETIKKGFIGKISITDIFNKIVQITSE